MKHGPGLNSNALEKTWEGRDRAEYRIDYFVPKTIFTYSLKT